MSDDWRKLTDYVRCGCCGTDLEGMIQETIPGRKRVLVECKNPDCHKRVKYQTLRVHEHVSLCYTINHIAVKS